MIRVKTEEPLLLRLDLRQAPGVAQPVDEAYDIRNRIRAQLSHHTSTLSLDGPFGGAKFAGYLFVQETLSEEHTDLPFSWRELLEQLPILV